MSANINGILLYHEYQANIVSINFMITETCHDANIVVNGGTIGFEYGTPWCLQWRHSWHHNESRSSVVVHMLLVNTRHIAMEIHRCLHSAWRSRCTVALEYTFPITDVVRLHLPSYAVIHYVKYLYLSNVAKSDIATICISGNRYADYIQKWCPYFNECMWGSWQ